MFLRRLIGAFDAARDISGPLCVDQSYSELVPLRASGRKPPLFCVGGGDFGEGKNFQDMIAAMQVDQSVYEVRMVNLDKAYLRLRVEQVAADYLQQVCKAQVHGPYRLLGYSFGGLVVYAMAVDLVSRGEEVGLLALVETPNPAFFSFPLIRKRPLANRVQKYLKNLSHGRIDYIALDVSRYVRWTLVPNITHRVRQALGRPPSSLTRYQALNEMWNAYAPKGFGGRLVLFRAEDRKEFDSDPSMGWRKIAQRVDVHFVSGDHVMIMRVPNVLTLVEKLAPYLAAPIHGTD
jgi:thioesterase domain-containing protein